MKRFLLYPPLLTLLLFSFSANGQSWCPPGANWYYGLNCNISGGGYDHLNYTGDTIIKGITCKIVSGSEFYQHGGISGVDTSTVNAMYTYESGDTIYYLADTIFSPFIYLNARTGDTLKILNGYGDLLTTVVDSNGKTVINNDSLRYYYFRFIDSDYYGGDKVIERVGLTQSRLLPTYPSGINDFCYYSFTCYSDDSFPVYSLDTIHGCYDKTLDISNVKANTSLQIKPNPANDYIVIDYGFTNSAGLTIYNSIGQTMLAETISIHSTSVQIDVSHFASGVYFLALKSEDGTLSLGKLVKQ